MHSFRPAETEARGDWIGEVARERAPGTLRGMTLSELSRVECKRP